MFDPEDPVQFNSLTNALSYSRWRLQPFRQKRFDILSQYVGYWYSETGADDRVPVNLLKLASGVYLRQLISKAPRALCDSQNLLLKPLAADLEAWMNDAIVEMELAETLRLFVLDGLISLGIMKCGEAASNEIDIGGYNQLLGQPFAERVDLDDWVHDITARHIGQCGYMGNRYRISLEEAQGSPLFDKKARERLVGMTRFAYNERGEPRVSTLSQSTLQFIDEYKEHVELWDIWLPREKLVLTIPYQESADGGMSGPPLRIVEWKGPKEGPFILLSLNDVPNNVMPSAPAQDWMDLHLLTNRVMRKVGRQSDRQKTVLGVAGPNTEDGDRIVKADDGQAIRVDRPDAAREFRFGGADRDQMLFHEQLRAIFNVQSGNIEAIGGLSPQSHTLGQDKLLNEQSSAQVAEMQARVQSTITKVYRSLAHWWIKDPVRTYTSSRPTHGGEVVPVVIPPAARNVPFRDLDITIDPYSMQDDTPGTRAGKLMQMATTFLLPAGAQLESQGLKTDWKKLIDLLARYMSLPDLLGIVTQGPPPQQMGGAQMAQGALQGDEGPGMPAVTSRTHVRQNQPSITNRGHNQVMQQLLAGGGQPAQRSMIGAAPGGR